MNSFQLKLMACFLMVVDHVGYIFFPQIAIFRIIGRLSFPIFAFLIGEGSKHTKNLNRYLLSLFIFAIISQPFYHYIIRPGFYNVFFSLFLGLISLEVYKRSSNKTIGILAALLIGMTAFIFNIEYGFYGIMMTFILGTNDLKKNFTKVLMLMSLVSLINILAPFFIDPLRAALNFNLWSYMQIFAIPALLILFFYNGKRGPRFKYFFYLFYPLHLSILVAIKAII